MLWASSDEAGYFECIARSASGTPEGPWIQESELFTKKFNTTFDGGHGMVFTDTDGQMYLTLHCPNIEVNGRKESPIFIPVRESAGTIVWDLYKK